MPEYNVRYEDHNEQIDYGVIEANTATNAIEEIVKDDEHRKYIFDPLLRYHGMIAEEVQKNTSTIDQINEMDRNTKNIKQSYDDLERTYIATKEILNEILLSTTYGATFLYKNNDPVFVSIFNLPQNTEINGEKPYKFTLNFDQKTISQWITECSMVTENKN